MGRAFSAPSYCRLQSWRLPRHPDSWPQAPACACLSFPQVTIYEPVWFLELPHPGWRAGSRGPPSTGSCCFPKRGHGLPFQRVDPKWEPSPMAAHTKSVAVITGVGTRIHTRAHTQTPLRLQVRDAGAHLSSGWKHIRVILRGLCWAPLKGHGPGVRWIYSEPRSHPLGKGSDTRASRSLQAT